MMVDMLTNCGAYHSDVHVDAISDWMMLTRLYEEDENSLYNRRYQHLQAPVFQKRVCSA